MAMGFFKIQQISLMLWLLPIVAGAQIIPDRSLGNETSRVLPDNFGNLPIDRIEGGALRGQNLFHSFQEFSVNNNRGAYFSSPSGIQNIITRITGNNRSEIWGTLGVLGNSNLFF
ncbi:MAG: hypothetical protein CV045_05945 [Cyanobacteria bacterium M5B4]|nr:MAG: hypothetical protein CV045_05945 [Cyanobacteria bacterium M5B4]